MGGLGVPLWPFALERWRGVFPFESVDSTSLG